MEPNETTFPHNYGKWPKMAFFLRFLLGRRGFDECILVAYNYYEMADGGEKWG